MAFIEWNDADYSVDVREIDKQHKTLVGLINDYHASMKGDKDKAHMKKLLDSLAAYTAAHFKVEEKFSYEGADAHKREHKKFLADVTAYIDKVEAGKMILPLEVCGFLREWLLKHIQETNSKYVPLFKENGLI